MQWRGFPESRDRTQWYKELKENSGIGVKLGNGGRAGRGENIRKITSTKGFF